MNSNPRTAIERFSALVHAMANQYAVQHGLDPRSIDLRTTFVAEEATHFLRALDAGILKLSPIGECSLPTVHRATRNPTQPRLIGVLKNRIYFPWREYITQVGALARLVLDYGWPAELIAIDPRPEQTFDLAAFSATSKAGRMVIAVEAKKTPKELVSLLKEIAVASTGEMPTAGKLRDGEKKYCGLVKEKPPYFWAVSPGWSVAFSVVYEDQKAIVAEIPDLPSYAALASDIEGHFVPPQPNSA